jgi:predicted nucleic acid-binding protein
VDLYLDASVVVALIARDAFTFRADSYLRAVAPVLIVGDFAAAEFASAVARPVRMREISQSIARATFAALDAWMMRSTERAETTTADVATAAIALRRLGVPLRTADA